MDVATDKGLRVLLLSAIFLASRVNCQCTSTDVCLDIYQEATFTTKYNQVANIDGKGIVYIGLRASGADTISLVDCWLTPTEAQYSNFRFGITSEGCLRQPDYVLNDNDSNFIKLSGDFLTLLPDFVDDVIATCEVVKDCPVFTGCKPACSSKPVIRITSIRIHKQPEITLGGNSGGGGGNITSATQQPGNTRTVFIVDYQVILIVVVCILVLLLVGLIFILVWRYLKRRERQRENEEQPNAVPILRYETTLSENGNGHTEMGGEQHSSNTTTDMYSQVDRSQKKN